MLEKNGTKEFDFVVINKEETRYFQVTETLKDKLTQAREISAFRSTQDYYEKTILTTDSTYVTNVNGIKIVNPIDFLLS